MEEEGEAAGAEACECPWAVWSCPWPAAPSKKKPFLLPPPAVAGDSSPPQPSPRVCLLS